MLSHERLRGRRTEPDRTPRAESPSVDAQIDNRPATHKFSVAVNRNTVKRSTADCPHPRAKPVR